MSIAEALVASSYPVYDYRYWADPESPFHLYDCLKPALKKHIRVPEALLPKDFLPDMKLIRQYEHEKFVLQKNRKIKEKFVNANAKIEFLENELLVLKSYIEFEIDGRKVP